MSLRDYSYLKGDEADLIELYNDKNTVSMVRGEVLAELVKRSRNKAATKPFTYKKSMAKARHYANVIVENYATYKEQYNKTGDESYLISAYAYFKHFNILVDNYCITENFLLENTDENLLKEVEKVRRKFLNSSKKKYNNGYSYEALVDIYLCEDLGHNSQEKLIREYLAQNLIDYGIYLIQEKDDYVQAMQHLKKAISIDKKAIYRENKLLAECIGYLAKRHFEDGLKQKNIKEKILHYISFRRNITCLIGLDNEVYYKYEQLLNACKIEMGKIKQTHPDLLKDIESRFCKVPYNRYDPSNSTDSNGNYSPKSYNDHFVAPVKILNRYDNDDYDYSTNDDPLDYEDSGESSFDKGNRARENGDYESARRYFSDAEDKGYISSSTYNDLKNDTYDDEEQARQDEHDKFVEDEERKQKEHWDYYDEMGIE